MIPMWKKASPVLHTKSAQDREDHALQACGVKRIQSPYNPPSVTPKRRRETYLERRIQFQKRTPVAGLTR